MDTFVETAFKEFAECSICYEIMDDPKLLPCLHSFCLKCLSSYGKEKKAGEMLACPICRQEFQIPNGGYSKIQGNFFLNRIKELYQKAVPRTGQPISLCEVCELGNDGETKNADVENFCVDCRQKLCNKCSVIHRQFAISRMHQIVPLKSGAESSLKELLKTRVSPCEQHPQEKVQLYCLSCRQDICMLCFALKHNKHDCEGIEAVAEKERNLLEQELKGISERMSKIKTHEKGVEKLKLELNESVEKAESMIQKTEEKIIELIKAHKKKAIEDLAEKHQTRMKELVQMQQELETERTLMESFYQFSSMLLENGTHAEVVRFSDDACQKAKHLHDKDMPVIPQKSTVEIIFNSSDVITKLQNNLHNSIGISSFGQNITSIPTKVSAMEPKSLRCEVSAKPEQRTVTKTLLKQIQGVGCILGITVLENKIFVCRLRSPNVEVFDFDSCDKLSTFAVKNLKDPSDMTSCARSNGIYINGQEDLCIYKISTNGKTIDKWKMREKAFRISADNNGCVTVTFRETLCLRVYGMDGSEMLSVKLPDDVKSPRNAFFINSQKFVMCHGELGEPRHRVCELDLEGRISRWYGGVQGSERTLINVPVHMIRISEDRYLVADLNNSRVHLIKDFRLISHLLTAKDGIKVPRKLELYEDRLFVAQDDGRILVFEVTL